MITSIREILNLTGKSASLREIAVKRKAEFPVSLRDLVGAPPPGRIAHKSVSLDLLQRKFEEIINKRHPPLFEVKLNSEKQKHGQSSVSVAMVDRNGEYDFTNPFVHQELATAGDRLSFDVGPLTYNFYLQELYSNRISLNLLPGQPTSLELEVGFETEGPIELKVDGVLVPDIDLTGFSIKINLEFGHANGRLSLFGYVEAIEKAFRAGKITGYGTAPDRSQQYRFTTNFMGQKVSAVATATEIEAAARSALKSVVVGKQFKTSVSVDATGLPDGVTSSAIESAINSKLFDALSTPAVREKIDALLTRFVVGGDFLVTGAANDEQTLTIDYMIPHGQLEPFPETPQAPLDPGLLANIDHIVVLMMENRSFDHMLGYLSKHGGRSDVEGLKGGEKNRYLAKDYPSFPLPDTDFFQSPPHSHIPVEAQINGKNMDGFVATFAQKFAGQNVDVGRVMGYHPAEHVPVYDALGREFAICDHWFAAHPGPTFCNRFYTLTGRLNRNQFGVDEKDNPEMALFQPVKTKTLFDHLSDHGVSWHYYENRYCFLRLFERYTLDDKFIVDFKDPFKGFVASAQAGTLPAVSFIDPNFVDEPDDGDNDDGPPADIRAGQNLIGTIVNALMNGPNWQKTLLLITYDEHGGFFDHVSPYDFLANAKRVSGIDHYGVRVPTFVVSPWVDAGSVSKVVFDHTSIPKTIIRRFLHANPPDMGERVTAANDLSQVLRSTPRTDRPTIPTPPRPQANAFAAKMAIAADPETDDFKDIMRAMRARFPLRR